MPIARVSGCGILPMPVESELFVTSTEDNFISEKGDFDKTGHWEFTTRVNFLIINYEYNI